MISLCPSEHCSQEPPLLSSDRGHSGESGKKLRAYEYETKLQNNTFFKIIISIFIWNMHKMF